MVESKKRVISRDAEKLNSILVENFVNLQKVMTNMVLKFDNLSENISKLLNLFEISARSFVEKLPQGELEKDKEFLEKLNMLLDQNKTIAKGLTLMEEKMRERLYGDSHETQEIQSQPQPRFPPRPPQYRQSISEG